MSACGFLILSVLFFGRLLPAPPSIFAEDGAITEASIGPTFETIALGRESAYPCRIPALLVIRDQEDWQYVWNLHHGREASKHQLPTIDFRLFSVIALFSGPSRVVEGIEIVHLERLENAVTVSAVEVEPGLGCSAPTIFRNSFHMVLVPALKRNISPSLEIEILSRQCGR